MYVINQNADNKSKANKAKAKIELFEQAPQPSLANPFAEHSYSHVAQVDAFAEAFIHVIG
jgi:hypothetical protein